MATHRRKESNSSTTLVTIVVVVAVLYFGREIFIPLALAVLFSFLLAPLVNRLRRWGLPRLPAVITVVVLTFLLGAFVTGLVSVQLADLGRKLPEYQNRITEKLQSVRESSNGFMGRVNRFVTQVTQGWTSERSEPAATPDGVQPVPVEIRRSPFSPFSAIRTILGPLINVALLGAVVVLFAFFMLLQREDARDRFIRLVGSGQLNVTTRAIDEAAQRVSRFLVAQLILNISFGIPAAIALHFIGVPNPVLWGIIAAVLRYVPYLGTWVAAALPALIAFAVEPGWVKPVAVCVSYFLIDLLMYNLVEPLVYGNSTGITPLGIIVSAVFWTWLWGPVGLLLATPLTVCAAVIGRYVPSLHFLSILLMDEPVLEPEKRLYQRLLARDVEEAMDVAEETLKERSIDDLYDDLMVPALRLAEADRHDGKLDEAQQRDLFHDFRLLIEYLAERASAPKTPESETRARVEQGFASLRPSNLPIVVLALPACDEADELAALMLSQLLSFRGLGVKVLPAAALASEQLEETDRERPSIVCITAVPPSGWLHARYLGKRLRADHPGLKLIAAILTRDDVETVQRRQPQVAADQVVTRLKQAVAEIVSLVPGRPGLSEETAFSS